MNPRDRVLAQLKRLPTLPAAAARISDLAHDDTASARDWEMAIKPDPALTANLLRLANSSFFGYRGQIESARHAITLLGTKRVFDAAMGAGFAKVIPTSIPGYGLSAPAFWQHSTAVAILSERLAARLLGGAPALAFTSGLLHDIGKPRGATRCCAAFAPAAKRSSSPRPTSWVWITLKWAV
jgi:HD-like signal output (HDOD) protein